MTKFELIRRGEPEYEAARVDAIWNGRVPNRYPDAIGFAHDEAEVRTSLELARAEGWHVAVRSGGHNFVGNAIRDDGLLLDLSRMRGVEIDELQRTAVVEPGADNEVFIQKASALGLTFSVGHCPSVCLGGFLLGGGLGFNTGEWGYANESVTAVDVVTADGRLIRASEAENPELFWAARGSGPGFFGVVVRYHLALRPHPEGLWSSSITLPLSMMPRAAAWLDEITPTLDPRVEPMGWMGSLHGHEIGAEQTTDDAAEPRVFLLNTLVFADDDEEAQRLLEPFEVTPFDDDILSRNAVKTSFTELFDFQRVLYKKGRRYAVDCHWTDTPPSEQPLEHVKAQMNHAPSARTHVLWQLPFGNYREQQPDMAASILGRYFVSVYTVWEDPADDDRNIAWLRDTLEPFEAISTGHYAGDVDLTAKPTRAARTLSDERWAKYLDLKRQWDPESLFRLHLGAKF
ncbi:FAD-binding oxidoreductase [Microbacterium maritypicum]|uniref:FAD-binding oxidoreductase n=1 Tax=Microbacterium maritypicum TaxID=33918 RepID=UPI00381CD136